MVLIWLKGSKLYQRHTALRITRHVCVIFNITLFHDPLTSFSLASDLDLASQGWDLLFRYHGRPSGIFAADEYLAGLQAARGQAFIPDIT